MANRTKLTPDARTRFLDAIRKEPNISAAARLIGVSRGYMYEVKADPAEAEFAKAWEDAIEEAVDDLEVKARERARGWVEPIVNKDGDVVGERLLYSDRMMELMLKAHRPELYREAGLSDKVATAAALAAKATRELTPDQIRERLSVVQEATRERKQTH